MLQVCSVQKLTRQEAVESVWNRSLTPTFTYQDTCGESYRQKYTILESTLPINFIITNGDTSGIDEIVTVCSTLCNCCESIFPFE